MSSTDTEHSWRLAILFYLCCPVLLVFAAHERYTEKRKALKPISILPATRKRTLSIRNDSSDGLSRSRMRLPFNRNQKTCLFLEKLPPEVREMIYIQVLGDHIFRIERRKYNLGHITCQHAVERACRGSGIIHADCSMYGAVGRGEWPPRKKWGRPERDPDANLLGLAKTCRTIYRESIDILYSHNIFHLPHWTTLNEFSATVLPQRINALKTLHIKLHYKDIRLSHVPWHRIWDQISEIPKLETLKIEVNGGYGDSPFDAQEEHARFAPLMEIKTPRVFEIETSWPVKATYQDAPFKISTARETRYG